jgi:hypothetical protein
MTDNEHMCFLLVPQDGAFLRSEGAREREGGSLPPPDALASMCQHVPLVPYYSQRHHRRLPCVHQATDIIVSAVFNLISVPLFHI